MRTSRAATASALPVIALAACGDDEKGAGRPAPVTVIAPTALSVVAATTLMLAMPAPAEAHGLFLTPSLPVPTWMFAVASALVVVVSFVALSRLWAIPILDADGWRPVADGLGRIVTSRAADVLAGATGVAVLVGVIVTGFEGTQDAGDNFGAVFVFVLFWAGLPLLSVLVGDVARAFNPWRAIGRAAGWAAHAYVRPADPGALEAPLRYPEWLGRIPAALGLLAFGFLELASDRTPRSVALAATLYTVATLIAMALFGWRAWCERGEAFCVYFGLYARMSAVEVRGRRLGLRRPLAALTAIAPARGTVLLLAVMIGAVSYDGATSSPAGQDLIRALRGVYRALGLSGLAPEYLANATAMASFVAAAYAVFWLGMAGVRSVRGAVEPKRLAGAFAPSLVPIALGYLMAHNLSLLLIGGQSTAAVLSDPLGTGKLDLFGTAGVEPDQNILSAETFWYMEVGAIVLGHVAGLALAHDIALRSFARARDALRSQRFLLVIMVSYTLFALWLLVQATGA